MANPKAQTLQQRFGFVDNDLKTANHDEIMMWLNDNAEVVFRNITKWNDQWAEKRVDELANEANQAVQTYLEEKINYLSQRKANKYYSQDDNTKEEAEIERWKNWSLINPPEKSPLDLEIEWEHAILSNKFTIGFIDMKLSADIMGLDLFNVRNGRIEYQNGKHDFPVWFQYIIGKRKLCFEVKTTIPSLGELIRQIRMYEQYEDSQFYVVAPDDKFTAQLNAQGIGFVKYPTGEIYKP